MQGQRRKKLKWTATNQKLELQENGDEGEWWRTEARGKVKKEEVWGFTGGKNRAVWNRSQEEREKNPRLYIYFKKSLCIYQAQKELWVAVKQGNMH